jgi:predicted MFS family arabinose efflux permease
VGAVNPIGTARRTAAELGRDGRGPPLVAIAAGWFLALGMRLVVPGLLPVIRADLAITNATAGLLVTLLWVAYALTQFPSGVLSDHVGERRVFVASALLGALGVGVVGATTGVAGFAAGLVLYGVGTGFYATPRVMVVSRLYPERTGTALGLVFASGNVGNTVLPAVAGVAAASLGWRAAFLAAVPLFVASAAALGATTPTRDGEADADRDGSVVEGVAELRRRPVQAATATLVLFAFAYQGFIGFLTTYLVDVKGLPPETSSTVFGGFFAVGLVTQVVSGGIAERYGRRRLFVGLFAATTVGVAVLTVLEGLLVLAVAVPLLGVQLGIWPGLNAYAYDVLTEGARGGGYGFLRTVYLVIGATGPAVVGALFDAGYFDGGFLLLAGVFALVLLVAARLPDVRPPAADAA